MPTIEVVASDAIRYCKGWYPRCIPTNIGWIWKFLDILDRRQRYQENASDGIEDGDKEMCLEILDFPCGYDNKSKYIDLNRLLSNYNDNIVKYLIFVHEFIQGHRPIVG